MQARSQAQGLSEGGARTSGTAETGAGLTGRGKGGSGKVQSWGERAWRVGEGMFRPGAPLRRLDCGEGPGERSEGWKK